MPLVPQAVQLLEPDETASYEMLPREGVQRFHMFTHYRDLPSSKRSVKTAWEQHVKECLGAEPGILGHKLCPNRYREWGTAWNWSQRARDWDRELDRRAREKLATDQIEARARHQQLAKMALTALGVPVRATLMALQNPEVMNRLVHDASASTAGLMKVLDMVTWATKNMPGLVDVERMALGMETEKLEMTVKPEKTGMEIAADPAAVDIMAKFISHMANKEIELQAPNEEAIEVEHRRVEDPEPMPESSNE